MSSWASLSFVEVLEDLSSRFIVNLPSEELQRIERICFQVEQAHWFYEDFLRPLNPSLPSLNLRKFSIYILQTASLSVPLIRQYVSSGSDSSNGATVQWEDLGGTTYGLEAAFDEFLKYKTRVPVCGAVLLCDDWKSCLLVKGWKSSASWGFPKGKINQNEPPRDCAVRETYEETGFDCSHLLKPDSEDWMELNVREQKMRLYIVPGVKKDTVFETQTRKEISKIAWFKLADLPTWKQSKAAGGGGLASANASSKFYLVTPFIGKLKHWINENKKKRVVEGTASSSMSAQDNMPPTGPAAMRETQGPPTEPAAMRASTSTNGAQSKASTASAGPLFADPASSWPLGAPAKAPVSAAEVAPSAAAPRDDSAALMAMLQGSLNIQPSVDEPAASSLDLPTSPSPLPAPRPQKSSTQTLKLLEMLSPGSSQRGSKQHLPAGQSSSSGPSQSSAAPPLSAEEQERQRKRELLLQALMGGANGGIKDESLQQGPSLAHLNGSHTGSAPQASTSSSKEDALLALLSPQASHPPAPPAHAHRQKHSAGGPPGPPPSQQNGLPAQPRTVPGGAGTADDAGRNDLLAMLNAGPMRTGPPPGAAQRSTAMGMPSPSQTGPHVSPSANYAWGPPPPRPPHDFPPQHAGFAGASPLMPHQMVPPPHHHHHHAQHGPPIHPGGPNMSPAAMHDRAAPPAAPMMPPPHHVHQHHAAGAPPTPMPPFNQPGAGPAAGGAAHLLAQLQPRPPPPHMSPMAQHQAPPHLLHQQQQFSPPVPQPLMPHAFSGQGAHLSPAAQHHLQQLSPQRPPQQVGGGGQPQSLLALLNGS